MKAKEPAISNRQTEVDFELSAGYADEPGVLHRKGTMSRATAADDFGEWTE